MDHIRHLFPRNILGTDYAVDGCNETCDQNDQNTSDIPVLEMDLSDSLITSDIQLDDADNVKNINRLSQQLSTDSGSTFEILEFCSPEPLQDSSGNANKLPEPEVGTSSILFENKNDSERNAYLSASLESEKSNERLMDKFQTIEGNIDESSKLFRRMPIRLSSKEEKQRQNEEIVIMESSSETGSWEAIYPQWTAMELKESCKSFLIHERQHNLPYRPMRPTLFKKIDDCISKSHDTNECPYIPKPTSGACFIDASSLLDDTEVSYSSLIEPRLPEIACCGPYPVNDNLKKTVTDKPKVSDDGCYKDISDYNNWSQDVCFGKNDYELTNAVDHENRKKFSTYSSSISTPDLKSPNLSDEQKLLHRDSEQRIEYDIKDQYSSDSSSDQKIFASPSELRPQNEEVSRENNAIVETECNPKNRQEQERKQGNFLFKNSIQHFSGHIINPKIVYTEKDENFSDMSLPSIYSNTSEPYNDYIHGFETGSQYSSNFGDVSDCGESSYSRVLSETESIFYPDTPHNSIVHVDSPRSISRNDSQLSSKDIGIKIPKRTLKCDESAPIVSGGASIKDFTPKQYESPSVRRKTETCPILSGGFAADDFDDDDKPKVVEKQKISSLSTWVVDMSDCNLKSKRRQSESSSSSIDNTTTSRSIDSSIERSGSGRSHKSGLGFYVSLNDIKPSKKSENSLEKTETTVKIDTPPIQEPTKKATGFYVNFSDNSKSITTTPPVLEKESSILSSSTDSKNIFSMFVDFGEKKIVNKRAPSTFTSRLSSSLQKQNEYHQQDNEIINNNDKESAIKSSLSIIRRSHSPSSANNDIKRHSWNPNKVKLEQSLNERTRSASLSTDKENMSILEKIPLISKTSSMSVDSPNSPYEDFTCSKSLSSYSNNSNSFTSNSIHSSADGKYNKEADIMGTLIKRRRQDAKINETFDKSSQGSLADGILSKDSSPTTDTDDITFQNEGENISRNAMMETIRETKETVPEKQITVKIQNKVETHTMETLQATIEKQKLLLETVNEEVQLSSFVKLSDMDKPVQRFELHNTDTLSKSMGSSRIGRLFVDNRSNINRNSWHTMSRSTGNNLISLASSVENLKSLSRLFPHLSKEFSNSLPADIQIEDITTNKFPNDYNDYIQSDISCTSSLTSSFSRSGIDSADDSSLSCRQPRRLGEDLLKMFLQEIATDVTIEVGGRRMRAHKCILRSRCQYFAAILAGGWVQSAGNVISLPGYSYGSVHFALCHIYSGASHPPEGISLMELSALADLLSLEGLKEVTAHALRTNYCHNFHKPCSACIEGILQVFPITLNHGLDDLYRKCLRWSCKHYVKVWPTRAFAQLPVDIIGRCKQHVIAHLTSETVLSTLLDCDHLLSLLAPCRWAIAVENTVRDIIDIAHSYIADHFSSLIASDEFLSLGHGQSWNISRLESILLRIGSTLLPEQACRSYQRVTRLATVLEAKNLKISSPGLHTNQPGHNDHEEEMDWNPEFIKLVKAILSAVEHCLTRQCARAMRNNQWQRMDLELRKKIQKLACLADPVEVKRPNSLNKPITYSPVISYNNNRNQNLHQVKLAIQAHSKRAQESNYRPSAQTQTQSTDRNTVTIDKSVQAYQDFKNMERGGNKISKSSSRAHVPDLIPTVKPKCIEKSILHGHRRSQSETSNIKLVQPALSYEVPIEKPHVIKLAEVKPRYLEPRSQRNVNFRTQTNAKAKYNNISSSDSSTRNSSPAANKQNLCRPKKLNDSTNMSRDSLASPAKQSKSIKNKNINDFEISVDSLGDSLKSSIKTDKTLSQESLVKYNSTKSKDYLTKPTLKSSFSRSNPMINKVPTIKTIAVNKTTTQKSLSHQTTTENSPSSVTTKSSRLSSITSAVSSPRNDYKRTLSLQAPVVKKSFLSAKSKEILAKKQSNNQIENTKSASSVITEKLPIPVNKSHSTSNILNRRAITFPTTLHLRRTAKLNLDSIPSPIKNSTTISPSNNKKGKVLAKVNKKQNNTKSDVEIQDTRPVKIESKLERSSTFCKESADVLTNELQIIE